MAMTRQTGTIRVYVPEKGYGFLTADSGDPNVFFHASDYGGSTGPAAGVRVSFELVARPKGLRAVDVGDEDEAADHDAG
jgi:CspA family cold shock protein